MSSERSERLADLFARAIDLDAAAQQRLLAEECADDPALRAELARLLAADHSPIAAALDDTVAQTRLPQPGELVAGRYRVLREVGAGGMGVVFAAEQLEPRRQVALKCIRPGLAQPDVLARFRREAALLGRLQHPGIAQVFEAGIADGDPPLPFLAMEFVHGIGLAEACRGQPLAAQLELFAQLAEAVAHAHERGIVHRDLKPGNVLVEHGSAGARVKVLDFGIGRLIGEALGTQHTRTHQLVGTLAYVSPEQVERGSAGADARSDVWSLGVTLFELLAGRLPLPLQACSLAEAARVLRDEEPTRLDRWVPALRGDIATIVQTALAKEPKQRYADAGALAQDLRRHLANQPIAARPPGTLYRLARFARRHRGLVAGLAIAFAALAIGLASAILFGLRAAAERDRATQRTAELRGLLRAVVVDVDHELATVAGTTSARRLLLATGLQHAEGMAQDAGADAELLLQVADTFLLLAKIQGAPGEANLGDVDGALASVDRAGALLDRAAAVPAPAASTARVLAARLRQQQMQETLLRALRRAEPRAAAKAAMVATAQALAAIAEPAIAHWGKGIAAAAQARHAADAGDDANALAHYATAHAELTASLATVDDLDVRRRLATLAAHRALLLQRRGDLAAARSALEQAIAAHEQVLAQAPGVPSLSGLANALRDLATHTVQFERDAAAALVLLERARDLLQRPAAEEPQNVALQRLFLTLEFGIGDALGKLRRTDEALVVLRRYVAAMDALAARPGQESYRRDTISGRQLLGLALGRSGDRAAAEHELERALATARAEVERQPALALAWDDLALTLGTFGTVLEAYAKDANQEPDAQRTAAVQAIALLEEQEQVLRTMLDRGLLATPKRAILDALPPRLQALRERLQ